MPRQPRLDIAGVPHHVVQRGNDRQPCFFRDADYFRYRQDLAALGRRYGCAVHAYALLTNHVHLLITPDHRGAIARLMQTLGTRYVPYVNDTYGRTGTLWEGRYKSCPVDTETYLLRCYRYIELNPVRAGIVRVPSDYPWSSFAANALGCSDALVSPHPCYLSLATDADARIAAYREWVAEALSSQELETIRTFTRRQHALGSERFQSEVEAVLGRRARPGAIGRPRKSGAGAPLLEIVV